MKSVHFAFLVGNTTSAWEEYPNSFVANMSCIFGNNFHHRPLQGIVLAADNLLFFLSSMSQTGSSILSMPDNIHFSLDNMSLLSPSFICFPARLLFFSLFYTINFTCLAHNQKSRIKRITLNPWSHNHTITQCLFFSLQNFPFTTTRWPAGLSGFNPKLPTGVKMTRV